MKKLFTALLTLLILCNFSTLMAWGGKGHKTICTLAESHLNPKAKAKIESYLDGKSIVEYASWMDKVRKTPEYLVTDKWHTAPVDTIAFKYSDAMIAERGNAIYGLELAINGLKDYKNLPDSTVGVYLKYIIHLVADMHCPAHIKYLGRTMNYEIMYPYGDKFVKTKTHTIWDSEIINTTHPESVEEIVAKLSSLSKREAKVVCKGTPRDWLTGSAIDCYDHIDFVKPNAKVEPELFEKAEPMIMLQMQRAGYRMANLLNTLFAK